MALNAGNRQCYSNDDCLLSIFIGCSWPTSRRGRNGANRSWRTESVIDQAERGRQRVSDLNLLLYRWDLPAASAKVAPMINWRMSLFDFTRKAGRVAS